jgi:phosphoglycolate phosphatase-like HAD superfamily hydrolase
MIDPSMHAALNELQDMIHRRYPEACFRVGQGEDDPSIVQLVAVVDVEDTDQVLDVVIDRLLDLHAEGLPIFVVTERPRERTVAMLDAARHQKGVAAPFS